ncbi:MAG: hydroxymethylbilane synthase [Gemmatimonadetes bacterium]|nr:hydroxymethylbilane synthase [Gemmatimonadota bacterium]
MSGGLKLGTRGSPLALFQARLVRERMRRASGTAPEIVIIRTAGDSDRTTPLEELGEVGIFTAAIDRALLAGEVDVAVHSLKDAPSSFQQGIALGAVLEREDPRDTFLPAREGETLRTLPPGAVIATGSLRRRSLLLERRPDLETVELRGNMDRRIQKRNEPGIDGVILAEAAMVRLEQKIPREVIAIERMLPACCQGIIGITVREGEEELVSAISDAATMRRARAERSFLRVLDGGCRVPLAAHSSIDDTSGALLLEGLVADRDGRSVVRRSDRTTGPPDADSDQALGENVARAILDDEEGAALLRAMRS